MPEPVNLAKAELRQLDGNFDQEIQSSRVCPVQFNPESLKVSFTNQLVQPPNASGDQRGSPARQFIGSFSTKLALTLWFDVGSPQPGKGSPTDDVRRLTEKVAYFIAPQESVPGSDKFLPPAVRFVWGTFQFDGLVDSLEENLELFSPEGKPLRASVALGLSKQRFQFAYAKDAKAADRGGGGPAATTQRTKHTKRTPGTKPLAKAPAGANVQGLADAAGMGGDWQAIAAANGIENPRLLAAGTLVDLDLRAPQIGGVFGVEASFDVAAPRIALSAPSASLTGPAFGASIGTGG